MLEETIANFIDTNTALTVGDDLSIGRLIDDNKEGTTVIFNRDIMSFDGYNHSLVQVILFYYDYVACRTLANSIAGYLNARQGIAGDSWGTANEASLEYLGNDDSNRTVISISVEVIYKET